MISAKAIADSKNEFGDRITTMVVTFPRIILAEFNTHRMFSRNSASSRAIPTKKMIKMILETPFIPIAWQKEHSGMQGSEYYDNDQQFSLTELRDIMFERLLKMYETDDADTPEVIEMFERVIEDEFGDLFASYTLNEFWCMIRDKVVNCAILLYCLGVTKQICNRLLEPFMWHTVIVTSTEWENFFYLRCPKYQDTFGNYYRSQKDFNNACFDGKNWTELDWFKCNRGQAEIHMMLLAEAMFDTLHESTPKQLKPGEWHIPFGDQMELAKNLPDAPGPIPVKVKISTAMNARISYTVVGEEGKTPNYNVDLNLHDRLIASGHWSPAEHCARAMTKQEYYENVNGVVPTLVDAGNSAEFKNPLQGNALKSFGWSGNLKGFIQYRKTFKNENITK
jgi:hypothetical protein